MKPVREVSISLPASADLPSREAACREAAAVLASVAPDAALTLQTDAPTLAVAIDGQSVRLPRRAGAGKICANGAPAWPLFWALLARQPVAPQPARLALHGVPEKQAREWCARTLGFDPVLSGEWPSSTAHGLSGARLCIGALLSPPLDPADAPLRGSRSLAGVLAGAAAQLVGEWHAEHLLDGLQQRRPLLAEAVRSQLGVPRLTGVLRELVDEGVGLHQARLLCEALLAIGATCPPELDDRIVFEPPAVTLAWTTEPLGALPAPVLAQCARMGLKAHHASRYADSLLAFREHGGVQVYGPEWKLAVGLVDLEIERQVAHGTLDAAGHEALLDAVQAERSSSENAVPLLTTASARHALWRLLREAFPDIAVLAYQELAPEVNIEPRYRVSF
jgi:hypothetical protein